MAAPPIERAIGEGELISFAPDIVHPDLPTTLAKVRLPEVADALSLLRRPEAELPTDDVRAVLVEIVVAHSAPLALVKHLHTPLELAASAN